MMGVCGHRTKSSCEHLDLDLPCLVRLCLHYYLIAVSLTLLCNALIFVRAAQMHMPHALAERASDQPRIP